jgi:hypothetical protein
MGTGAHLEKSTRGALSFRFVVSLWGECCSTDSFVQKCVSNVFCAFHSAQNNGGAVYLDEFGITSISGRMSNNHAGKDGGAVASVGQSIVLLMSGADLSNNSAGSRAGAALILGAGAISGEHNARLIADLVLTTCKAIFLLFCVRTPRTPVLLTNSFFSC